MNIRRLAVEFATVFAVALAIGALVTFLWNTIAHAERTVDWETSLLLAVLFGIIQIWMKSREPKEE